MTQGRLLSSVRRRARLRRARRLVHWVGGLLAAYALLIGPYGFIHYLQLGARQHDLELESRKLVVTICDLEQEIRRLTEDTLYIEKIAREQHGFARPDERVHKITAH